ncbi:MAG: serine/threonine-protein phosphatase [Actinobacteria bacterium]|nr:serine/threonine-protein phosphatase [Actinomycetota bacterium]
MRRPEPVLPLEIDVTERPRPAVEPARATSWGEPLQRLALALIRAVSLDDVAAAAVAYGPMAAGAGCGHALLLDNGGEVAVSLLGGPAVPSARLDHLGLDATLPWNDAVHHNRMITFPSTAAFYDAYPGLESLVDLPTSGPVVTTPLVCVGECRGSVTFSFEPPAADDGGDLPVDALQEIAAVVGQAAARAAIYASEHQSAELLQRAYMPARLSPLAGLSFATRYLPAGEPAGVGGDWYDVLPLPGPLVGLVIGDVAGHGLKAAAVMASLRAALRAFATVEACPARILARLNDYTCLYKPDAFATVFVAVFDPETERLRYARAGHPPALLVAGDGATDLLDGAVGPPLGLPGASYQPDERRFPAGASLVAYTDGLIERRDKPIDARLAQLVEAAPAAAGGGPDGLCDWLVFELLAGEDLFDDAALLVAARQETPDGR